MSVQIEVGYQADSKGGPVRRTLLIRPQYLRRSDAGHPLVRSHIHMIFFDYRRPALTSRLNTSRTTLHHHSPLPAMSSIRGRLISVQPMQMRSKSSSWFATKFFASTSFSFMTREWQVSQSIIRPRETPTVFLPVLPAISIRPILSAGP